MKGKEESGTGGQEKSSDGHRRDSTAITRVCSSFHCVCVCAVRMFLRLVSDELSAFTYELFKIRTLELPRGTVLYTFTSSRSSHCLSPNT